MSDYQTRRVAVADAVDLLRGVITTDPKPLDLFDVLEVARFLLDDDEAGVCSSRSMALLNSPAQACVGVAGHIGDHSSGTGFRWTP